MIIFILLQNTKIMIHDTKFQSFIISILIFLPILFIIFYNPFDYKKLPGEQMKISIAVKNFVISNTNQIASAKQEETTKEEIVEKKPIEEKPLIKKDKIQKTIVEKKKSPLPIKKEKKQINQKKQISQNQGEEKQSSTITDLVYGRDDNPFLKSIKKAIDEALIYPHQARRMGISGEVLIEFVWLKNKSLKELKIIKSSGKKILEKSALETIKKAAINFPSHRANVRIQVPIVYKLEH